MTTSHRAAPFVLASALLATLAGCEKGSEEMDWARAALERNERLEIVDENADSRSFTVRNKDTGELRIVRADEISAGLADAATAAPGAAPQAAPAPTAPLADAGAPEDTEPVEEEEEPAPQPAPRASEPPPAVGSGRVIASGPGYSIQAGDPAAATTSRAEDARSGATERRSEPLVCQGSRFLRIDGRSIAFEGDALVAEEGCELHITNSRITARGVGVAVRGANVHIRNSTVAGEGGAIQASGDAQIYAQSSRFRGMVRRLDEAVVHDMGGNVWN